MFESITAFLDALLDRGTNDTLGFDERQIATAALLVHTVAIDGTITEAESRQLTSLLAEQFHLSGQEVDYLRTVAEDRERKAVDIYRFTSVLRDALPMEEKRHIIAMMWRAVYADGRLDPLEDNLVWRTSELLGVPASDRLLLKQLVQAERGGG